MKQKRNSNYIEISFEELYDLYITKQYSVKKIAKEFLFCSHVTILNRLKEHNIKRRPSGRH